MARLRLEFTIEPFVEGSPGAHVLAAIAEVEKAGLVVEDGPFGSSTVGDESDINQLVGRVTEAAFAAGATRVSTSMEALLDVAPEDEEIVDCLRAVVVFLGGTISTPDLAGPTDLAVSWRGHTVAAVRRGTPRDVQTALTDAIADVEAELGLSLSELSRTDKQRAVRLLLDRGVFAVRNAVDDVAVSMGVSRATIYNYLSARPAPANKS